MIAAVVENAVREIVKNSQITRDCGTKNDVVLSVFRRCDRPLRIAIRK